MSWQLWVVLSGILTGLGQSIGKSQIHKISALQMGVLRDVTGLVVAAVLFVMVGGTWAGNAMWIGMLNGAMVALGVALYFIAVRSSFSGSSIFGYLISQVLIVVSSAFVFGEWVYFDPSRTQGLGNIVVLGLTLLAMVMYSGGGTKLGGRWAWIIVISALINVAGNLIAKQIVSGSTEVWSYFLAEQTGLALMGVVILILRGQNMRVGWVNARVGVLQGIVAVFGPIIYLHILSTEPLSLASIIRRIVAIVVTVVSGLWWYREGESMGLRGYASLVIGIVAFVLIMVVN